jgi:hypothetical protein
MSKKSNKGQRLSQWQVEKLVALVAALEKAEELKDLRMLETMWELPVKEPRS